MNKKNINKNIAILLLMGIIFGLFFGLNGKLALGSSHETIKIIESKDNMLESGYSTSHLNAIAEMIAVDSANAGVAIVDEYENYIVNDLNSTAILNEDMSADLIQGMNGINVAEGGLEYVNETSIAPRTAPSILPIYDPCDVGYDVNGALEFTNCNTINTTDRNPIFVSYFMGSKDSATTSPDNIGYTIVEIRNKSDDSFVNRMFIGKSIKGADRYVKRVNNMSYTYGIYQEQDLTNLFGAGGNLNTSTGIETLSYPDLDLGEYTIYLRNVNIFGVKSAKTKAGYLKINPEVNALLGLDFEEIGRDDLGYTPILTDEVNISFNKNVIVNLLNPEGYTYEGILPGSNLVINGNEILIKQITDGKNILALYVKDNAGNIIDTKNLIINVDTISPEIKSIGMDEAYLNEYTTDKAISLISYLGIDNANDHIKISGIDGEDRLPMKVEIRDNSNTSDILVYYSLVKDGVYVNIPTFTKTASSIFDTYEFEIDGGVIPEGKNIIYFKFVDKSGNSIIENYNLNLNRVAEAPIVKTNDGEDILTTNKNIDIDIGLSDDTVKVLINGYSDTRYTPFDTAHKTTLSLNSGTDIYSFQTIDILGNVSQKTFLTITKNPGSTDGISGNDTTLKFEGGVKINKLNLQRVTGDNTAGESFSE